MEMALTLVLIAHSESTHFVMYKRRFATGRSLEHTEVDLHSSNAPHDSTHSVCTCASPFKRLRISLLFTKRKLLLGCRAQGHLYDPLDVHRNKRNNTRYWDSKKGRAYRAVTSMGGP